MVRRKNPMICMVLSVLGWVFIVLALAYGGVILSMFQLAKDSFANNQNYMLMFYAGSGGGFFMALVLGVVFLALSRAIKLLNHIHCDLQDLYE